MSAETRLSELGIELPAPARPMAAYTTFVQAGDMVYTSGHGPFLPDGGLMTGKVGLDLSVEEGREAARLTGLAILSTLRDNLGSLDRVQRFVKVLGMVNCPTDFHDHPSVIDGFSELIGDVFGEAGVHARSAVGMGSLPFDIPVEIEVIVQVG